MVKRSKKEKSALVIVDVQNDFCPGGSLAVPHGDEVVPKINQLIALARKKKELIFASRDWHPEETSHFKIYGGLWPIHCVMHSEGAKFHQDLKLPKSAFVISKGMKPGEDAYSAFDGKTAGGYTLNVFLDAAEIVKVYVCGLATDFCVKATVVSASEAGYKVVLVKDACRAVFPDKETDVLKELEENYCEILTTEEVLGR